MTAVLAVGAAGQAIAAKLAADAHRPSESEVAMILTDGVTPDVEQIARSRLAAGTPVLITALTGTRLTVGPLYTSDGPAVVAQESLGVPESGGAPEGVLAAHVELAAVLTRWYLDHGHTEALIVDLAAGVTLRRPTGGL